MDGSALREAREAAGITLPRMATITGEDKGNLSRAETGKVKVRTLRAVAMLYDIALGNEPYTLVREVGDLPATLRTSARDTLEYVSRLTYLVFPAATARATRGHPLPAVA